MVRDLEMLQGPNLKTNILKTVGAIYKIEGNINIQHEHNAFIYKK
jgi:hypothetical protein